MKKYLLSIGVLLSLTIPSFSQHLEMHRGFGSTRFEYSKDTSVFTVSPKQVLEIMGDDQLAYQEFKKAKSNSNIAALLGFAGAALIVFPLGTAIAGGEPEWGLAAGGAALIVTSIPFNKAFKRHAQGAIDTYNKAHSARRPHVEYLLSGLGARVTIKF